MTLWMQNQIDPAQRQCALVIADATGVLAPSGTDFTGHVMIRLGGTAFTPASGSLLPTGKDGDFVYEATQAETNADTNEVEIRIVHPTYYANTRVTLAPVTSGSGLLISATATGPLNSDEEIARWTPVVLTIEVPAGMSLLILAKCQQPDQEPVLTLVAYSDELGGFQPQFQDKSTVTVDGTEVTLSILPNGGWIRPQITIVPYVAWEMQLSTGVGGGAGLLQSYVSPGATQFSGDWKTARNSPITLRGDVPATMSFVLIASLGDPTMLQTTIWADELVNADTGNSFQTLWSKRSSLSSASDGSGGRLLNLSVLPNGGWVRESATLVPYAAWEATP